MNLRAKSCIAAALLAATSLAAQVQTGMPRAARSSPTPASAATASRTTENAYPKYSVPKLGGQNAAYIVAALAEYEAGARWHPTMRGYRQRRCPSRIAPTSRPDFTPCAEPDAGAEPVGTPPEQAATCVACHGKNGTGTMDEYPNIAGQHAGLHRAGAERLPPRQAQEPHHAAVRAAALADDIHALAEVLLRAEGPREPEARLSGGSGTWRTSP